MTTATVVHLRCIFVALSEKEKEIEQEQEEEAELISNSKIWFGCYGDLKINRTKLVTICRC